jgi:hypothetical protein
MEPCGRVDFEFASPTQTLAEIATAIEGKGGRILGLGTLPAAAGDAGKRIFYLRIAGRDPAPFVEALRQKGCLVHATHAPSSP